MPRPTRPQAPVIADNLQTASDVVPNDIAIQVPPGGKEHPPRGRFDQVVGKPHILLSLRPTRKQKEVDRNPFPLAELSLPDSGGFGPRVWRIEQVQHLSLKMSRREAVGDQHD